MNVFKIKAKQVKYWHRGTTRYGLFLPAYLKFYENSFSIFHKEFACFYNAMNDSMPLKFYKTKKRCTTKAISNAGLIVLSRFWCCIPLAIFIFV